MRTSSVAASLLASAVVFLHTQPVVAAALFFSASGSGTACSLSAPCQIETAIGSAPLNGELACADSSNNGTGKILIAVSLTIDCAGTAGSLHNIIVGAGAVVTLRNFTIWRAGYGIQLLVGTVILDNVHIFGTVNNAIIAEPTAPSTLIVKDSIFDNGGNESVLLKPEAGGSLNVTFDHLPSPKTKAAEYTPTLRTVL
jgi:hypothetical protein